MEINERMSFQFLGNESYSKWRQYRSIEYSSVRKMDWNRDLFNGILVDEMIDGTEIQTHWR